MTVDTSEMVVQWREAIARGGHRAYSIPVVEMVALLDALEAERERVRVLTEALEHYATREIVETEEGAQISYPLFHDPSVARAALATAGGEGATT